MRLLSNAHIFLTSVQGDNGKNIRKTIVFDDSNNGKWFVLLKLNWFIQTETTWKTPLSLTALFNVLFWLISIFTIDQQLPFIRLLNLF